MLLEHVDYEEGRGQTVEVGDRAQSLLQLGALTRNLQTLALGEVVKSTVLGHLVDGGHLLDGLADGGEVGEHAARPALDHVGHAYALCQLGDNLFGLFLGSHEEHFLAALGDALQGGGSLVELGGRLVKINNVDTVALHEDIGRHGGVPFAFEVAEVAACFKKLVKSGSCHFCLCVYFLSCGFNRAVGRVCPSAGFRY